MKNIKLSDVIYENDLSHNPFGKKGTILAVDTRGFHKGKDLTDSNRLLLQIEFSNSMFGQSYPKIDIAYIKNSHRDLADHNKNTYGEIFN